MSNCAADWRWTSLCSPRSLSRHRSCAGTVPPRVVYVVVVGDAAAFKLNTLLASRANSGLCLTGGLLGHRVPLVAGVVPCNNKVPHQRSTVQVPTSCRASWGLLVCLGFHVFLRP